VALKAGKVDPFELRGKLRIAQNALIKIVHDSAYGRSPANDVVVTQAPASRLVTHACSSFRVADVANKFTFTCHVWTPQKGGLSLHHPALERATPIYRRMCPLSSEELNCTVSWH
jgi:hypothetical protein